MRRVLGLLLLAIGISGIFLSIIGILYGIRLVDSLGDGLQANLTLTLESLDTVRETLILTKSTVAQLDTSLSTVEETANNVSVAIEETRPLLLQGSEVVTQDVPESIETFQTSMPALIEVSGAIDSTLRTLSAFGVNRTILGIPLSFDLGVEYDPEVPFDQSITELGESLEGMPEDLRSLEQYINTTNDNLLIISQNIAEIGRNLEGINSSVGEIEPLIDDYILIVTDISDRTRQTRVLLDRQLDTMKLILTIIMIWFGFMQLAPIYLGWEIISGARDRVIIADDDVILQTVVDSDTKILTPGEQHRKEQRPADD